MRLQFSRCGPKQCDFGLFSNLQGSQHLLFEKQLKHECAWGDEIGLGEVRGIYGESGGIRWS